MRYKTYIQKRSDKRAIRIVSSVDHDLSVKSIHISFEDPVNGFPAEYMPDAVYGLDEESARLLYQGLGELFTELDAVRNK